MLKSGVLRLRPITTLDLPELAPYRTMRQQADHFRDGLFVAEGPKVVERLLATELEVISALLTPDHLESVRAPLEARAETVEVFVGGKPLLERLTGFPLFQGLLACARRPPALALEVVCDRATRPRFFVALDGVTSAENVGLVVRNAAAFGAQALLIGETCAHPYLRRAVRASMGTLFGLPILEPPTLVEALRELRRRGVRCLGAHPHTDRRWLPEAKLAEDLCIVLGSEGEGLSPAVQLACDERVAVPMQGGVDSLNVGAAAAVFLYEVWRQRSGAGGGSRVGRAGGSGGSSL